MSISAVLKRNGHLCSVAVSTKARTILKAIKNEKPDAVGLSVMVGTEKWSQDISRNIKRSFRLPVIWGGPYPTLYPEVIYRDEVDIVCLGEGEVATLAILDALEDGRDFSQLSNLWVKKGDIAYKNKIGPLVDLNKLPFLDRDLYERYKFFEVMPTVIQTDRYCFNNCSFCIQPMIRRVYKKNRLAYRDETYKYYQVINPERIIEELEEIKRSEYYRKRKNEHIQFNSDNINGDPTWFRVFFTMYADKIRIPFLCSANLSSLTEEQARLLRDANAHIVGCGIESGSQELRTKVLKKRLTDKQIYRAAELYKKYGLFMLSGNMIGIPGESTEQAFETLRLHHRLKSKGVVMFLCHPYPGSALEKWAVRQGFLPLEGNIEKITTFHDHSPMKQDNIRELENLHKLFLVALRFPRLEWFFRKIITVPPNKLFDAVFLATHGYMYLKLRQSFTMTDLMRFVFHHSIISLSFLFRGKE